MKKILLAIMAASSINMVFGDEVNQSPESNSALISSVVSFKGVQITGVTLNQDCRMFANAPRWRTGVPYSVVEIMPDKKVKSYPNESMNNWEIGQKISNKFISVQSVVAHNNKLYVLDTANPLFHGIITQPRLYVYDLTTNELIKTYILPKNVVKHNSYTNDLRVDDKLHKIYITDSGEAGLIILDVKSGKFTRVLDNSIYTKAETDHLTIDGEIWKNTVHADGIALDEKNGILYIHALTGYTLYGIKTADLSKKNIQPFQLTTSAPDGMTIDESGNLYFGDLEHHKIAYLTADRTAIKTLVASESIKWPDTFSIYNGYLYFSNSRINEAKGDITNLDFTIDKVKLPTN